MGLENRPEQYINHSVVHITDRCNFKCRHCCEKKDPSSTDMDPETFSNVLIWLDNPLFNSLCVFGGEARIHPKFGEIIQRAGDYIHGKGGKLSSEQSEEEKRAEEDKRDRFRETEQRTFGEEEMKHLIGTGEYYAIMGRRSFQMDFIRVFGVHVFSNGFGMSSPEKAIKVVNDMHSLGVSNLVISDDRFHRAYAEEKGIKVDYDFVEALEQDKSKHGIHENIRVSTSGNENSFFIPVGQGRDLSWQERIGSQCHDGTSVEGEVKQLKRRVGKDYDRWSKSTAFAHHCYCYPAEVRREFDKLKKYRQENRYQRWSVNVNTNQTVTACPFNIIPPLGSISKLNAQEAYDKLLTNSLYSVLAYEGPQGVARLVWNIDEKELRARFIERTPCGLCEDLAESNYSDLQEMMDTTKEQK